MRKATPTLKFRLRFPDSKADAFGPGKADLLEFIRETGSIPFGGFENVDVLQPRLEISPVDERSL